MHYYKRHIGDYAKKAGHLSPLEHGVYNLIIDSYYDREQAPTVLEAMRWARARTEDEKAAVLAVLDEFFTLDGDRYRQSRIEEELSSYHNKAETNRQIAITREQERRLKKDRREHDRGTIDRRSVHEPCTNRAPESDESCTSGQPNHKPVTTNHKPVTKEKQSAPADADAVMFPGVDPQVVADFKQLRKKKRAPITATAMEKIAKEAQKAGVSLEDALRVCCSRGWQGFEADWLAPRSGGTSAGSANSDKFRVANLDHSSSRAAMEASMKRHNIVVPEDGDITF